MTKIKQMKRNFLLLMLTSLGVFQVSCHNSEQPFGKIKKIVVIKRSPISDTKEEFIVQNMDVTKTIENAYDLEFIEKIKRKHGISIVKQTYLGFLVTDKNDTSLINILMPGGTIVDFKTKRKYGFSNKSYQERLKKLLMPKAILQ